MYSDKSPFGASFKCECDYQGVSFLACQSEEERNGKHSDQLQLVCIRRLTIGQELAEGLRIEDYVSGGFVCVDTIKPFVPEEILVGEEKALGEPK